MFLFLLYHFTIKHRVIIHPSATKVSVMGLSGFCLYMSSISRTAVRATWIITGESVKVWWCIPSLYISIYERVPRSSQKYKPKERELATLPTYLKDVYTFQVIFFFMVMSCAPPSSSPFVICVLLIYTS